MVQQITLNSFRLHSFKKQSDVELDLNPEVNEIYGRNGSGKTTIADAIAFAFTGTDFWGRKINGLGKCGASWVEVNGAINGVEKKFRRLVEYKDGSAHTVVANDFEVDKQVFLSVINPRYFCNLSAGDAKRVIMGCAGDIDGSETLYPQHEKMLLEIYDNAISSKDNGESMDSGPIIDVWDGIEAYRKKISKMAKDFDEQKNIEEGKYQAFMNAIDIDGIDDSAKDVLGKKALDAQKAAVDAGDNRDAMRKILKRIDTYRSILTEIALDAIKDRLDDVEIVLDDNGKDVFSVQYHGVDFKTLSNAEQLKVGLEIANVLAGAYDVNYPCIIDNAECIQDKNLEKYNNLNQFVVLSVADCEISSYSVESNELIGLKTRDILVRPKEELVVDTIFLGGWGG